MVTVPFAPLERWLRLQWGCDAPPDESTTGAGYWCDAIGAAQCDTTYAAFQKWRQRGGLPVPIAERVAAHQGVHPADIWGWPTYDNVWQADAAACARRCVACGREYTVARPGIPAGLCGERDCTHIESRRRASKRRRAARPELAALV